MESQRNYNVEILDTTDHKYAYNFDFDVMHPYMMRSFEPFPDRKSSRTGQLQRRFYAPIRTIR